MNIGRNDKCACGSGKKFKNCCLNSPRQKAHPKLSTLDLSRQIAYAGDLGGERKKWCEDFIIWKTAQLDKISAEQSRTEASTGRRISCSKGCWFCCCHHVGATLQECDAIVYWLHAHDDVRAAFLMRYHDWRNRIREHEDLFQQVNQAITASFGKPVDPQVREALISKAKAYQDLNILCPFLDLAAHTCSIYPVRPFVCAHYVVVSPSENCKCSSGIDPTVLLGTSTPELQPPYFRGPKDGVVFSPAALLVHEILNGGFIYINDLPGFAGLEQEAFSDPEIRALVRNQISNPGRI